jgi:hypothetical protein
MSESGAHFEIDDPVRIAESAGWAGCATGRIALPQSSLIESMEVFYGVDAGWDGASRTAPINGVMTVEWWVAFDEPQLAEDGDGPMAGAAFAKDLLEASE